MAQSEFSRWEKEPFMVEMREAMIHIPNASPYHFANQFNLRVSTVRRFRKYWAEQGYNVDSFYVGNAVKP